MWWSADREIEIVPSIIPATWLSYTLSTLRRQQIFETNKMAPQEFSVLTVCLGYVSTRGSADGEQVGGGLGDC